MRLDKTIAVRFGLSRRSALEAVRRGHVDVAGLTCLEPGKEIAPGTEVSYNPGRAGPGKLARRLDVVYQDKSVLIVNKPAGVLTQPTSARERDTLLERAGRYLARKQGLEQPYVGIVHRLDRDTTGVLLLVIDPRALRAFQALFRAHETDRRYLAVVEGVFATTSGRIDLPLIRDRGDGRRGVARQAGQGIPAVTRFEVLETFGQTASLLSCQLETGRTHQIRIHLAEIGHPVVGDRVYRPRTAASFPVPFRRQALHACALAFTHPIIGRSIQVEVPLPGDLESLIARLRER
jgi:23S rRNA pseudouridine1911/1915/1917 synthase